MILEARRAPISALLFTLFALILVSSPVASHDLYLEPSSFHTATGTSIAIGIGVGHAFAGAPLPYTRSLIDSFTMTSPSGVRRTVAGIEGVHPAGIVRFDEAGSWNLVYHGRPWLQSLSPARFAAYLAEVGRMDLAMTVDLQTDEATQEWVHRCARTMISVTASTNTLNTLNTLNPATLPGQELGAAERGCDYDLQPVAMDPQFNHGKITVQVLRNGKPANNVRVLAWPPKQPAHRHGGADSHAEPHQHEAEHSTPRTLHSDSKGFVELSIDRDGPWILSSVEVGKTLEPETGAPQWQSWWASLSFDARHARHTSPAVTTSTGAD